MNSNTDVNGLNNAGSAGSMESSYRPLTRSHARPAIRKVSTKSMDRKTWLQVRLEGIGASEAAAAAGIHPYQSQLELWMIKTGRIEQSPELPLDEARSPMYWGQVLEPIVAEHYAKLTQRKVRRVNAVLQHPDADKAWMLANLDYSIVACDEVQILECKTAGEYGAAHWKEGVPEYVQCQVQHQLAVTGKQRADVGVLICGQEFRTYRIERDDELIEQLIALERQFWDWVQTDTPPPADASDSAQRALSLLYPKDNGVQLDWQEEEPCNQWFDQLLAVRSKLDQVTQEEALLKHQLQQALGDASSAKLKNGTISFKRSKDGVKLNTEQLLADHPELLAQYATTRQGSRRFLVRS